MNKSRYWVNDETRYVRATTGEDVTAPGWREVTGAEFDAFRAETRANHPKLFKGKRRNG